MSPAIAPQKDLRFDGLHTRFKGGVSKAALGLIKRVGLLSGGLAIGGCGVVGNVWISDVHRQAASCRSETVGSYRSHDG
jgi:hypothetical protein